MLESAAGSHYTARPIAVLMHRPGFYRFAEIRQLLASSKTRHSNGGAGKRRIITNGIDDVSLPKGHTIADVRKTVRSS